MVRNGLCSFTTKPIIISTGVTAGPLEKMSPFARHFDKVYENERINEDTNEKGHMKMIEEAAMIAMSKIQKVPQNMDYLLIGDLVNQMTPSNFAARQLEIPYLGMFSACATSVSSLLMAALLTEMNFSNYALAGAASQHNAIERQFRYPVEYGAQKPETAQWTATASGVAIVSPFENSYPIISKGTVGRVVDMGITDPLHMGAAMAPAAMDTLKRHLDGHQEDESSYDLIMTGDLGIVGFTILKDMAMKNGLKVGEQFQDAGANFYGGDEKFFSGASGAGCSAAVYFSEVYQKMLSGQYEKVLLIATGSLLSPLSYQQGETIPCIAHAVELTMKE